MFTDFADQSELRAAIIPLPLVIRDLLLWFAHVVEKGTSQIRRPPFSPILSM